MRNEERRAGLTGAIKVFPVERSSPRRWRANFAILTGLARGQDSSASRSAW